jgi:predicted transcriptional regulator
MGNQHRQHIYSAICHSGGMTCDELEVALNLRHQTASCFVRFLTQDKFLRPKIKANGEPDRRRTRSGRMAIVWEPAPSSERIKKPDAQLSLF